MLEITEKNNKYHDKEGTMEKLQEELSVFLQKEIGDGMIYLTPLAARFHLNPLEVTLNLHEIKLLKTRKSIQ